MVEFGRMCKEALVAYLRCHSVFGELGKTSKPVRTADNRVLIRNGHHRIQIESLTAKVACSVCVFANCNNNSRAEKGVRNDM